MVHWRAGGGAVQGDNLVTNRLRPILLLRDDTWARRHDTISATCDIPRYAALGWRDYPEHRADTLPAALGQMNLRGVIRCILGRHASACESELHRCCAIR